MTHRDLRQPRLLCSRGFLSCKKFCVSTEGGRYPGAMLVKELIPGALAGRRWPTASAR